MKNYYGQVGGTLCPEYFHSEYGNRAEHFVGKAASGKIVISSKSHLESKVKQRKAVRECYCYSGTSKIKLYTKTITNHPSFPCDYCKSNFDVEISVPIVETVIPQESMLRPRNCETLRRVESIIYSPISLFLREVQKKSSHQKKPNGTSSEFSMSSSLRPSIRFTRDSVKSASAVEKNVYGSVHRAEVRSRKDTRADYETQPRVGERQPSTVDDNTGERIRRKSAPSCKSNSISISSRSVIKVDDKERENVTRKSRSSLRKTIRSADCLNDNQLKKERSCMKNSPIRIMQTISTHRRCCIHDDSENVQSRKKNHRSKGDCEVRECSVRQCCGFAGQLFRDTEDLIALTIGDHEDKVRELKEFRNDNYFETHGSTQTLVNSSRSSGAIQQVLNDGLFPEAVGKIHRDDFVVMMRSSATKHRKRIHYFPRHIDKQDKSISNTNYNRKEKRSQGYSLTGHAVDHGVLKKPCEVSNSLALRYQKGVMEDKIKQFNYH